MCRGGLGAENMKKVKHLLDLPKASTHLSLFRADLVEEGSFDDAIQGCSGVFHVATPMTYSLDQDQEVLLYLFTKSSTFIAQI